MIFLQTEPLRDIIKRTLSKFALMLCKCLCVCVSGGGGRGVMRVGIGYKSLVNDIMVQLEGQTHTHTDTWRSICALCICSCLSDEAARES